MKTYTDKGNCARAAKAALGKDAKNGVDFTVGGEAGKWHWTAIGDRPAASHTEHAPAAKKVKAASKVAAKKSGGKKPPIEAQPANVEVIKMMQRVGGATIEQICERKEWTPHTTRAVISRLRSKAKVPMTMETHGRKGTFHVPAEWSPKE